MSCLHTAATPLVGIKMHAFTRAGMSAMKRIAADPFVSSGDAAATIDFQNIIKELFVLPVLFRL